VAVAPSSAGLQFELFHALNELGEVMFSMNGALMPKQSNPLSVPKTRRSFDDNDLATMLFPSMVAGFA